MRTVIQRVQEASVVINEQTYSRINRGLLIFLSIEDSDDEKDVEWLTGKICRLRIFDDENARMNLSVKEINGEILLISQFTLHASTKKGNRPSYIRASKPDYSIPLYKKFIRVINDNIGAEIKTGEFGADMKIRLINDDPVTIIIDTKNKE